MPKSVLPQVPLHALTCFEVAGRHLNFSKAARELGVTQAAVSKQIKSLETLLNVRLFERGNRAVTLTASGRRLFEGVGSGFKLIGEALDDISGPETSAEMVVTTTVAIASLWLMPYIANFRAEHPDIGIRVIATDSVLDFRQDDVDVAIRYGNGDWPHLDSVYLFTVRFFPVCSPRYLQSFPMATAADIQKARLLCLNGPAGRYSEWDWWFSANDIDPIKLDTQLSFNNYPLLVQAAIAGQGVLLAWGNVIDDLIANGSLVPIIEGYIPANQSYYLVTDSRRSMRSDARIFRDWLLRGTKHLR